MIAMTSLARRASDDRSSPAHERQADKEAIAVVAPVIVVVEDEVKIRRLVRGYLEREGYSVVEAASGAAALELAPTADLIILDLGLPDRDGLDVARQLRRSVDIPIIILTARAGEAERIAGLRLGADDYVSKPFSPGGAGGRGAAPQHRCGQYRGGGRVRWGRLADRHPAAGGERR